jgi:hypothetical protein
MLVPLWAARGHAPVKSSRPSSQTPTAPAVCAGRAEHHRHRYAPAQPARACGPSTARAPPQHPDVGGACRRAAGGKLRETPPARGLLSSRGQARNIQTPQSTSSKGVHPRRVAMPWLHRPPTRRSPRGAARCVAGSGQTTTRVASCTHGNWPAAAPMSTGPPRTWLVPTTITKYTGRQTPLYGWKTSGSLVGLEERTMIISSSSTSPSVSGSSFERGSNSYRPTASVAGRSSNRSLLRIFRGRTCSLKTLRTSRAANKSLTSPCGTTSAGSPSNAILSLMSWMQTSSARSSQGPP